MAFHSLQGHHIDRLHCRELCHILAERSGAGAYFQRSQGGGSGGAGSAIDLDAIRIEGSDELKVLAPRTGVFYTSPTPDDPPYVDLGQQFDIDQTLCLLEAMKVFEAVSLADFNRFNGDTLFETKHRYRLNRILAENGQTVNQGDLLFIVQPAPSSGTAE